MHPRPTGAIAAVLGLLLLAGTAVAQSPSAPPPSAPPPSAIPTPTPTPDPLRDFQDQPGTDTTPGGLDWQQVDGPTQARRARLGDLMTWSGGFVAVEWRERRDGTERAPAVWSSPDGRAWTRAPLPRLDGDLLDIVPFRGGLALLAIDRRVALSSNGRAYRITVWRSDDATTWRPTGTFGDTVPAAYVQGWRWSVRDPMTVNGRLVFIAHLQYSIGSGGWLGTPWAMRGAQARLSPGSGEEQLLAWSSRDGTTWSAAPVTGIGTAPTHTTWAPEGVRAFDPKLHESRDGIAWERIAGSPPYYEWGGPDGLLWADGASLVFADNGDPDGMEGCGNRLGVWRLERDGWVKTLDRQAAAVNGADADGRTVILTGDSWCQPVDENAEWSWILVSWDGGRTWDPETSWVGAPDTCVGDVAIHDGRAVLLACSVRSIGEPPHPAFWVTDLP